jgi:hypothetical protein
MNSGPSGEYYDYTKTMKPERPFLLPYHQSLTYLMMICTRGGDGKLDTLYRTFEDTLAAIRKVYELTCGIPQVIYLVGWHHEGHDSKYPDWSEVNSHLKRDCDATSLESLRWLIREARKYNATVSLHLKMMDAYPDSPLWDEYVEKDIIAKDRDGNIIKGKEWGGMVSYQMSYTQEWKTGMAQKRIDAIIEMIPELVEGKTIHIDAFLGARPLDREAPISPYLGYTKGEELATQRKIYRYWRDRGIDVTYEWVNGFRGERFVGLQAWAWHLGGDSIDDLPPELYCTNPMEDARHLSGSENEIPDKFLEEFCLILMPWHYKNNPDTSDDPHKTMIADGDSCIPALWCDKKTLVAYSRDGYESKTWLLPADWQGVAKVKLSKLTPEGPEPIEEAEVVDG